jgi:hypothetical protein
MLNLPICLQWKFKQGRRVQFWIQGGPEAAFNIGKRGSRGSGYHGFSNFDMRVCMGIGANICGAHFDLAPEIRFQQGFLNRFQFYQNGVRLAIPNLFSQILNLVLTFE